MALWLAGVALAAAAVYALACWLAPFGECRRCSGNGQRPTLLTGRLVSCSRCRATGRRLRIGRRAYNAVQRRRRRALRVEARGARR